MKLSDNDFELFALTPRFAQDRATLDARWKELQRQAHPDKFASEGAAAQRLAMQWSVRINEAYQRLKDPVRRAAYLCELAGVAIDAERNTAMPTEFLMQQMELREALEEASNPDELDQVGAQASQIMKSLLQKVEQQLDVERRVDAAAHTVRSLLFIEKLQLDIERAHELLGQ
jgi:molecular chaperone HscB